MALMKQSGTKRIQYKAELGGKGDVLGIVQEIKVWPRWQILNSQNEKRSRIKFSGMLRYERIT